MGRNDACPCGSGRKYKRCCYTQEEILRRQLRPVVLPLWLLNSRGKLHQFLKYACQVFDLPALLASQTDSRRAPQIPTFDVVNSLFHTALLRIPSLNALEGDLQESDFQKLLGRPPTPGTFDFDLAHQTLRAVAIVGGERLPAIDGHAAQAAVGAFTKNLIALGLVNHLFEGIAEALQMQLVEHIGDRVGAEGLHFGGRRAAE